MIPSPELLQEAAKTISPYIPETPVHSHQALHTEDAKFFFKMENLMPQVHAFKARGALFATLQLSPEQRRHGLITHSSGNHGAALAWVGKTLGIPVTVVVPENSTSLKRAHILSYGAELISCAASERIPTTIALAERTGMNYIPPYDHYDVIAGQGTVAMEFCKQVPSMEQLVVPVGGGGLLSGVLLAVDYFADQVRVLVGEPANVDDAYRSLQKGSIQKNSDTNTIADGLRTTSLGQKTFPIIHKYHPPIVRVTEEEIQEARILLEQHLNVPVEPSSAVGYAAALQANVKGNIGIVLTGGNVEQS